MSDLRVLRAPVVGILGAGSACIVRGGCYAIGVLIAAKLFGLIQ